MSINIELQISSEKFAFNRDLKIRLVEDDPIFIGYNDRSDITLPYRGVSRTHASITLKGSQLLLKDCQSGSGTYVGTSKVDSCILDDESTFKIGPVEIKITQVANYKRESGYKTEEDRARERTKKAPTLKAQRTYYHQEDRENEPDDLRENSESYPVPEKIGKRKKTGFSSLIQILIFVFIGYKFFYERPSEIKKKKVKQQKRIERNRHRKKVSHAPIKYSQFKGNKIFFHSLQIGPRNYKLNIKTFKVNHEEKRVRVQFSLFQPGGKNGIEKEIFLPLYVGGTKSKNLLVRSLRALSETKTSDQIITKDFHSITTLIAVGNYFYRLPKHPQKNKARYLQGIPVLPYKFLHYDVRHKGPWIDRKVVQTKKFSPFFTYIRAQVGEDLIKFRLVKVAGAK